MSSYDKAVILDGELPVGFVRNKMTFYHYVHQAADWFCDLAKDSHVVDHDVMDSWHVDEQGGIVDDDFEHYRNKTKSPFYREDAGCVLMPVSEIPSNFDPDELCYEDLGQEKPEDYPDREAYKAEVQKVLREHPDGLVMVIHHHY